MTTSDSDLILNLLVEWESRRRPDFLPTAIQVCPDDRRMQAILRDRIEQRLMIERMIEPGQPDGAGKSADADGPDRPGAEELLTPSLRLASVRDDSLIVFGPSSNRPGLTRHGEALRTRMASRPRSRLLACHLCC